ncbi:MAG: SLC13 family permease [Pseudomonadales bacterium]
MSAEQLGLFALLGAILVLLVWGRFRYDLVAFGGLVAGCLLGFIPMETAFSGFGHPAVIIIALVLIVSRGLSRSGAIELLAHKVLSASRSLHAHIGIMAGVAAALSTVMNNVAALALLMPLDLQAARRAKRSPAETLMPLSFASILGGMVTLIGTPPNIVIATYREDALGAPFTMFDFAPVGLVVAVVGIVYVVLLGRRFIPMERRQHDSGRELENLGDYIAEVRVSESSKMIGKPLSELDPAADEYGVSVVGLVRRGRRLPGLARAETVRRSDLVILEGGPDAIDGFVGAVGFSFTDTKRDEKHGIAAGTMALAEVVVPEGSRITGRSAMDLRLLYRHGITLLGISRRGTRIRERVRQAEIRSGDILLLLGPEEQLPDVVDWLGCLMLAERGLEVTHRGQAWSAIGVFAAAILAASLGWIYLPLALAAVVVVYVVLNIVPLNQVYESVEWSVIVLLGAMIPIGVALESSGGSQLIAGALVGFTEGLPAVAVLLVLMVITMTLSDVLNNVATALVAAPIAIAVADRLAVNPDAFLMGVAVAASCAFLTPIGHKNNIIVMGPGGYRFGDYWRMGLPLEVLVLAVGVPMILVVWPL